MRRRDLLRLAPGLGLLGCDSKKPKEGMLGRMERLNKHVESFLMTDKELEAGAITPAMAFPSYHVAAQTPIWPDGWKLIVGGVVKQPLALTLDDLQKLPSKTFRIEHHCVEGWSAVAEWTGVPLYEIAKLAGVQEVTPAGKSVEYVEFRSFDIPRGWTNRGYWSSWDRASAFHPQTLLAYGMNGKPLTPAYGAPLKVYSPVKLGYKNVKYLSEVNFLDTETGGYWENSGYEWFGGV